jgi:cell division protein FtsB
VSDERLKNIEEQLEDIGKAEKPLQKYGLQALTIVFIAGGGWATLDTLADAVEEQEAKVEAVAAREADDAKKIAVLEANQTHIKEKVDSIDDKLDKLIEQTQR